MSERDTSGSPREIHTLQSREEIGKSRTLAPIDNRIRRALYSERQVEGIRPMRFEILGEIAWIETIASGRGIRELRRLNRTYGTTGWRKRKGIAKIALPDGTIQLAEIHWYEGHGQGMKEPKIKKYLE